MHSGGLGRALFEEPHYVQQDSAILFGIVSCVVPENCTVFGMKASI